MSGVGWIKIHRKILGDPIFQNEKLFKVWMYCLLKATHRDYEQIVGLQVVKLKPGEFIFGRIAAGKELNMSPSTVWRHINALKSGGNVDIKTNNKFSVVSIVNWRVYQEVENEEWTTDGQQMDNKRTTSGQQVDTNKNIKNIENIKKYNSEIDYLLYLFNEESKFNVEAKHLEELLNEDLNWVKEALSIAESKNIYNISYVKTILKNWNKNGKPENKSKTKFHNFEGETSSMADSDINDKVKQLMDKRRIK